MKIAFDAKRAYANQRGLGNYSRDTIRLITSYAPENDYLLCGKPSALYWLEGATVLSPNGLWKGMPSLWRSAGCVSELLCNHVDVYHGLSGEIPFGIHRTPIKTIVTMHDAIFVRYPHLYSPTYRWLFTQKVQYACNHADLIIAISEQTKRDMITFFHADERKIRVVYQGCHRQFREPVSDGAVLSIRSKYRLPEQYLLYVGALEPRKNLLRLVQAMALNHIDIPLVMMGAHSAYAEQVASLAHDSNVPVRFLHNIPFEDFPAIYRGAEVFVYPSVFEGFGIPIVEAMCVGVPVVTSLGSCFEETAGEAALYADPNNCQEIADRLSCVLSDPALRTRMVQAGHLQAEKFTDRQVAHNLLAVYAELA